MRVYNYIRLCCYILFHLIAKTVYSISFHPTSRYLVSAGMDKLIKCWNIKTGDNLFCKNHHTGNYGHLDVKN